MLKSLLTGIVLGVGIMIGIGAIGFAGMVYMAKGMEEATIRATEGMKRAGEAIEREFPAPASRDNMEAYRACLHAFDAGNADAAVDACRAEFRDWMDSPTFAFELEKLQQMDARARTIMTEYDNAHPTRYFD